MAGTKNSVKSKIANFIEEDESNEKNTTSKTTGRGRKKAANISDDNSDIAEFKTPSRRGRQKKSQTLEESIEEEETTNFTDSSDDTDENDDENTSDDTTQKRRKTSNTKRKRSDNRQVLVAADRENGKLQGIFLDAGHAAHVLGMSVRQIKSDLMKGTKLTKLAWLKVPAGDTLDQKDIERNAKVAFKEWVTTGGVPEKKKPGRKPAKVNPNDVMKLINKTNLNQLDEKTMRKLNNLLSGVSTTKKK
jgi:hypothetical protein